jgi:hypothetical protein
MKIHLRISRENSLVYYRVKLQTHRGRIYEGNQEGNAISVHFKIYVGRPARHVEYKYSTFFHFRCLLSGDCFDVFNMAASMTEYTKNRFEVLTAVKMLMLVFWVVTPCRLVY